jgi:hypothetical protein
MPPPPSTDNPLIVQAGLPRNAGVELDDSDFAHINTGLSTSSALTRQTDRLSTSSSMAQSGGNGVPGLRLHGGGATTEQTVASAAESMAP